MGDLKQAVPARCTAHRDLDRQRHEDVVERLVRIETLVGALAVAGDDHEDRLRTLERLAARAAGAKAALMAAAGLGGGGVVAVVQWLLGGGG